MAELAIIVTAKNQASAALKSVSGDIAGVGKEVSSVNDKLKSVGEGMQKFGGALSLGVTAPLLAVGGAALKASTDLNAAMANVASLGIAADRVNELKVSVQEIAIATGKSTDDIAAGLYQVESAFGDTADTVKILDINARLAGAGLSTTEEAIALTSAVSKAYGDTSAEMVEHIGDLAIKTVALGQTTLPELAGAIGGVTPMAAALGVTVEELFAQFAATTGVIGGTSEVATGLRATYQAIIKPTEDMAGAIGIVTQKLAEQGKLVESDLTGKWQTADAARRRNLQSITDMEVALNGLNTKTDAGKKKAAELTKQIKEQKKSLKEDEAAVAAAAAALGPLIVQSVGTNEALQMIADTAQGDINVLGKMFGSVEAINAVLSLTGAQAEANAKAFDAMSEAGGSLTEAFDAQTKGINANGFTMQQLKVITEVLMQRLGDGLAPAMGAVLRMALPLVDKALALATAFSKMDPSTQAWIVGIAGAAAAIGPLLAGVGFLLPLLAPLGGAFAAMISPIGLVVAGIAALIALDVGGIRTGIVAVFKELGEALSSGFTDDMFSLADAIREVWANSTLLNPMLAILPDYLKPIAEPLLTIIAAMSGFAEDMQTLAKAMGEVWENAALLNPMLAILPDYLKPIAEPLLQITAAMSGFASDMKALAGAMAAVWASAVLLNPMLAILPDYLKPIAEPLLQITAAMSGFASDMKALAGAMAAVWASSALLAPILAILPDYLKPIAEPLLAVVAAVSDFATAAGDLYTSVGGLPGALDALWAALTTGMAPAIESIKTTWGGLVAFFGPSIDRIKEALDTFNTDVGGLSTSLGALSTAGGEALTALGLAFSGLWSLVQPILEGLGAAFQTMWWFAQPALTGLGLAVGAVGLTISNFLAAAIKNLVPIVKTVIDEITAILTLFSDTITGLVGIVTALINGDWAGAWASFQTIVSAAVDFVTATIGNFFALLTLTLSTIVTTVSTTLADLGFAQVAANVQAASDKITGFIAKLGEIAGAVPDWLKSLFGGKVDLTGLHKEDPARDVMGFKWPDIPTLTPDWWPDIAKLASDWWPDIAELLPDWWPDIPDLVSDWWPDIPSLDSDWWPDISAPKWLSDLIAAVSNPPKDVDTTNTGGGGGGGFLGDAIGTNNWRGGWVNVGESGYESVWLPRGSRIFSHDESMAMAGGGDTYNITVQASVSNGIDLQQLAYQIADITKRKGR